MDALKRLLFSRGVSLHHVVASVTGPATGHGLLSAKAAAQGSVLLELRREAWEPYSASAARTEFCSSKEFQSMLDTIRVPLGVRDEQKKTFEESVCLATKLLSAKDMGTSPYVSFLEENSWPKVRSRPVHPLLLPAASLGLLSECAAYRGMMARKRFHSIVGEFLFTADNLNAYLWAMSLVLSRGISGRGYPFTMVPFLDLANHSMMPNCAVHYSEISGSFSLQTVRDIEEGEELTISYGDARNNSSIVGLYGFYEQDNLADSLELCIPNGEGSQPMHATIEKSALKYYAVHKDDTPVVLESSSDRKGELKNVCRVVLKDALDKIFDVLSLHRTQGDFDDGMPTAQAELKAIEMVRKSIDQKHRNLTIKLNEVANASFSGRESEEHCPHWVQTCHRYIQSDLQDISDLAALLEDFKAYIAESGDV